MWRGGCISNQGQEAALAWVIAVQLDCSHGSCTCLLRKWLKGSQLARTNRGNDGNNRAQNKPFQGEYDVLEHISLCFGKMLELE